MKDQKIIIVAAVLIIYSIYSVHQWFTNESTVPETEAEKPVPTIPPIPEKTNKTENQTNRTILKVNRIPLQFTNACSILEVFTIKPIKFRSGISKNMESDTNTLAAVGIIIFLLVLAINAILEVLQAKEEERLREKQNANGERRQSLAEFANKKTLRRESSKFGFQLFQISESTPNEKKEEENKESRRPSRPYMRGESTNSYLSEKNTEPDSFDETRGPAKLVKQQSVAKLYGNKKPTLRRHSSFPAMPLNPDLQALMLGHRRPSTDSDDESDGKGRRVRIIRRF